ncbi:Tumor susceptibility gene 101 protein [Lachnellula cervina]|uniref:Tumor susceptibility gene 101 protein n=1 Tax=Lachnellula cervina TaxID=1316786 RepID=A0A7D8YWX3_9HELO|nr:Tumor susceptibility gene 101 protein [Lachnellula cervina]
MAAVRQQVLNWLYSVLTSEYKDVNRTYNDVAQTLSHYSSLSPRTEVYTYENGASALLLQLSGTLPVNFRGTTYRFPIALWVQHGYPQEAPLVYVTPTEGMAVRPGQHVDPQGKIYHPYLVGWAEFWDVSSRRPVGIFLRETLTVGVKIEVQYSRLLAILRDVFANEPPVVSRQQNTTPPRPQSVQVPPPIPPLPPGVGVARPPSGASSATEQPQPPPPPPKPTTNSQPYSSASPSRRDSGPPLPPLPTQISYDGGRYGPPIHSPSGGRSHAPQRSSSLRYETAPPLPPQPQDRRESHSPAAFIYSNISATPETSIYIKPHSTRRPTTKPAPNATILSATATIPQPTSPMATATTVYPTPTTAATAKASPTTRPNRCPLTLPIPSEASTNLPAPPIPPNPEKDMMLHNIGLALQSQRQHTRTQTTSSLPGLESQHKAMLQALSNMQAEMSALESLTSLLNTNTSVLHTALHDADSVIESSQHRTAPNVDELLVAPTVVGNQLYELVSEERSLGDALFVLGRAVERGRVSAPVFAKMTRSLAREWYLKKALVRKIGRGMGLATY